MNAVRQTVLAPPSAETLQWAREAVGTGSVIASVRPMGVSSTAMHAVDIMGPTGVVHQLTLRCYHNAERLRSDPWYLPANEATVLGLLGSTEVPAPRLIAADTTPTTCEMPTLLTTRVPGQPPVHTAAEPAHLRKLAEALATIHEVDLPVVRALPPYRPYYDPQLDGFRQPPRWSRQPALWQRVFAILRAGPPNGPVGFIHRDYHPGQTLWADDWLVGIVDWTTGCQGPRSIDLARMRLNLAGRYGVETAENFLGLYRTAAGVDPYHPYWDLLDAADALVDWPEPTTMEKLAEFGRFEQWVSQAAAQL